jgi:hypothetical protein
VLANVGQIPTKVPKVSQARDSGIVGCPLDADPLDSLLIRLFDRIQGEVQIDFQALFTLSWPEISWTCASDRPPCGVTPCGRVGLFGGAVAGYGRY